MAATTFPDPILVAAFLLSALVSVARVFIIAFGIKAEKALIAFIVVTVSFPFFALQYELKLFQGVQRILSIGATAVAWHLTTPNVYG